MAGKIPDLADLLQEVGLNEKFWLPQLETMKVKSSEELRNLEGDTSAFFILRKAARYSGEENALRKLLKVDEIKEIVATKTQHEEAEQEAKKRLEDAEMKVGGPVFEARLDGNDRLDKHVQELEERILNIEPTSYEKSLTEAYLTMSSGVVCPRYDLDDSTLLQKASGGRALQGVLLSKNLEDQQKERSCLLKAPQNVSIAGNSCLKEDIVDFSSKYHENSYIATSDVLGHSIAVSAQTPVYKTLVIGAGVSGSNRNEEATEQTMYISTIKYCTMHVASYTFGNSDLKLSDDVRENLKKIMKIVKTGNKLNIQRVCEEFFHTYGSHVNQGPLQFGGKFWSTCYSHCIDTKEIEVVKRLQTEAVTASAGVLFTVSSSMRLDSIKKKYAGKCSESTLASTKLMLDINGGPTEVSDLSVWKAGLVANNSTWILTDRGSKLMAVWDVIGRNHQREFREVKEVLRNAWEGMTGLQSEPDYLKYDSEDVLREVSEWNRGELSPRKLQHNLEFLLQVKNYLSEVAHPQYWVDEYLSQEVLQVFLSDIVSTRKGSPSTDGGIKFLMQQIVQEQDLKKLSTRDFPNIEHVSEWLYKKSDQSTTRIDCEDFDSFFSYLMKVIEEDKLAHDVSVAANVLEAIYSLQSKYRRTYDEILIKILAFPFLNVDCGDVKTVHPLSLQDLELLLLKFTEGREKYVAAIVAGASALQKQSLLFLLAASSYNKQQESHFRLHLEKVIQMMEVLKPPLEAVLRKAIKSYLSGFYQLSKLKANLDFFVTTGLGDIPISLLDLLSTAVSDVNTVNLDNATIPVIQRDNQEASSLFSKLGLTEHYYKKLGLQDALCIRSEPLEMSLKESYPTEPNQLPFLALQKLMSFDGQCRSDLMKDSRSKGKSGNSNKIHPYDILLALIICSDHFLRQDLFARLAKCQYAVPFILPDPFTNELLLPLWAMRSITKEWKCLQTVQGKKKVVEHTSPIVKYPMPIVSFVRLGNRQKDGEWSKSDILNKVISGSKHFFHRDLSGGSFKQVLGDGLVDMSWYLPSGKTDDIFPDAVTFLNLHGDARSHPKQSRFLSQISSMCFILVIEDLELNEDDLKTLEYFSSSAGGITLLKDFQETPKKLSLSASSIELNELNDSEITDGIQEEVRDKLFNRKQLKAITIEEHCDALPKFGIHVDECVQFFKNGQEQANQIISLVRDGESIKLDAKEEMLPLQGDDLWRKWSNLNKEWHRLDHTEIEKVYDDASAIQRKKESIRRQQCNSIEALTPVMERFISLLLKLEEKTARHCFLQHLILNLNSLSEKHSSGLLTQYQATLEEMNAGNTQTKVEARKENAVCRGKLKELRNDMVKASFGLHHLLRELGQVYEAACEDSFKYGDQLSRLPKVAAELLLDGYPLELMDGDAAHVPVKWVQAVISELNKNLNDPHMFVLSVLGLQSTGKSTMLNTVFGLTFKTSAGRCTHGAFMQLLPVDKTIEETTGYSYVLVIDTEGLRAPELDSSQTLKHDNELATFTIGLANLTFINISGEVAGDLDDILQTTVHAFLRMTEVKQHPSCQFIHQNVGASVKTQIGRDCYAERLDKWTLDAAREENCIGQYERFSDVIQFDFKEDIHQFPGLWKGNPPMAPVNQGYTRAAQKMKFNLLKKLHEEPMSTNIVSFKTRIKVLWGALLQENFVFSFKNTEEIVAYNLLGTHFNKWEGEIQTEVLDWENKATNEINTEKEIERISDVVERKQKEVPSLVQHIHKAQEEQMQKFFADNKLKHTLVQWKVKFELKLKDVKKEWEAHADNHCVQLGRGRCAISKFEQDRNQYIAQINAKAQEVIANMKAEQDKLDESLEKKSLDKKQLEEIMKRKEELFTPEKLLKYEIKKTQLQCDDLTEEDIEHLLVGGGLTLENAKAVLKQGKLNGEELKVKFDKIWTKLVADIPLVYTERIDVEAQVLRKLKGFSEKIEGTVKVALKKRKLSEWRKEFFRVEDKHYKKRKTSTWFHIFTRPGAKTNPYQHEAQRLTEEIIEEAKDYLETIKKSKTHFNDAYVHELLQKIEKAIEDKSSQFAEQFTFTQEYRAEVYLTVCGYAVAQFEEMQELFREQNDPQKYFQKYQREPLFMKFKNQYYQTANEEAFASNLCASLIAPIRAQVEGSLGNRIVGQMKEEAYLTDKMALKAKILIDLGTERDFQKFITYLTDIKQSLRDWINHYTVEYCNKAVSSEDTQIQVLAKKKVSQLISFLELKVDNIVMEDTVASKWLATFCEDVGVRRELGPLQLDTNYLLPNMKLTLDLKNFRYQMHNELSKLEKRLHSSFGKVICNKEEMEKWQEEPYNLLKSLCGCTEQCPFCAEQCDLGEHSDTIVKHTVAQHRPQCVSGWHKITTNVLVVKICPSNVAGKGAFRNKDTNFEDYPYAKYRNKYPDWHIPPDRAARDSMYWMWFVSNHLDLLASHYKAIAPDTPPQWKEIEWENVKTKLKELYNL